MDKATNRISIKLSSAERKLAVRNLKSCPLCGSLNATRNTECFVCRWHGKFDHDSEAIESGLRNLMLRASG